MSTDPEMPAGLGGWPGYEAGSVERRPGPPAEVWITLRRDGAVPPRCGEVGREATRIHEHRERVLRDLPVFDAKTYLRVETCRVWCEHWAGPKRQRLDWVDVQQRVTRRLGASIWMRCEHVAIAHVARFFGVHRHTVKRLDKRRLESRYGTMDYRSVRVIGVDELALHKGHRYATVVVEPSRRRVLWISRGHGRSAFRPFFFGSSHNEGESLTSPNKPVPAGACEEQPCTALGASTGSLPERRRKQAGQGWFSAA